MRLTISIDGPTASGKTTLGMALAPLYDARFLDTGLTYRAVALASHRMKVCPVSSLAHSIHNQPADYSKGPQTDEAKARESKLVFCDEDITEQAFAPDLDHTLKTISTDDQWRGAILEYHRALIGDNANVIVAGRDVATTLLSPAHLCVGLTASHAIRRERRRAQYRNMSDRSRQVNPATARDKEVLLFMESIPNSIILDTSYLPAEAVRYAVIRRLESIA